MSPEQRNTLLIAAGLAVIVLAALFWPRVRERLEPRLESAWVAIETGEEGVARVGAATLAAGATECFRRAATQSRPRHCD